MARQQLAVARTGVPIVLWAQAQALYARLRGAATYITCHVLGLGTVH
jgi:hypothetical protein